MPYSWLIVCAALATFRLSLMLTMEDGPGDIFAKARTALGCYDYGEERYPDGSMKPNTKTGQWWSCPMCVSLFPVAPLVALMVVLNWWGILLWLGLAGMAALLFRWRAWYAA
jgi:hypothetical protein